MNVIFDIDGTLVQSYGFDTTCFVGAVRDVLGDVTVHDDWGAYTHVTDAGILDQILAENRVTGRPHALVHDRFAERVAVHLDHHPADCAPMPGAADMLSELSAAGVRVGFATGGWAITARIKLDHAGLRAPDGTLFSSDISPERVEIMRACHAGIADPTAPTIYIGDGEWDMAATAALDWHFIGIGPRLRGQCANWLEDFTGAALQTKLNELAGSGQR